MSAKPKHRGKKSLARGHKDARRGKGSKSLIFVGCFEKPMFRAVIAVAKEREVSTAEAVRYLVAKGLGLSPDTDKTAPTAVKSNAGSPMLLVTGRSSISIRAGARVGKRTFTKDTPVMLPLANLAIGADYGVRLKGKIPVAEKLTEAPGSQYFAGFHFAPGGNGTADRGGGDQPAINPCSVWDLNFRPACPDPRGMALVDIAGKKIWVDIYLLAKNHLANGTSQFGVTIADGNDQPENPTGGQFAKLDYATAVAVMKHHGKGLLAPEEFYAAAAGVTERSSAKDDPKVTGLDAPRTSKFGLMQATGNMWVWGHDGTPEPRASIFGGSWWSGGSAGSRCADVAFNWPGNSDENIGARGRSDHLQLG